MKVHLFSNFTFIFLVFCSLKVHQALAAIQESPTPCEWALNPDSGLLEKGRYVTGKNVDLATLIVKESGAGFIGKENWLKSNYVRKLTTELRNYWRWRDQGSGVIVPLVESDRPLRNHYSYIYHEKFQHRYREFLDETGKSPGRLNFENVYALLEIVDKKMGGQILEKISQKVLLFDRASLVMAPNFFTPHFSGREGINIFSLSKEGSAELRLRIHLHFSESLVLIIEYASVERPVSN